MTKINAEWHSKHKMPKNPSLDQRLKWHIEHARQCGCRRMSGEVLEEAKKRYLGTHQEFWITFIRDDHVALADWAAVCAEHVLPYFEQDYPQDMRPREAIKVLRDWIASGQFSMHVIRAGSLAAHAAAREAKETHKAACYAARAAGQAVATAHVPTHALGSALYALKAFAAAHPGSLPEVVEAERQWQLQCLPDNLRPWVAAKLEQY
jgi:hypothetical protein